jgi:chaperone required for assembly of F1-ATPase
MQRAQRQMRPELPLRFYKRAEIVAGPEGHAVRLDGRPVRTPGKRPLAVPTAALAEAIAEEWRGQGARIDPASMPLTRLANTVIDAVVERMAEVRADALKYAASDLVCYRAEHPAELTALQARHWDPILAWAQRVLGATFQTAPGITHRSQPQPALDAVRQRLEALDAFRLAALHELTTLSGSVLIALIVLDGKLDADAAWAAAHVDEDWQIRQWGEDFEAAARRRQRRRDFDAAVRLIRILSGE